MDSALCFSAHFNFLSHSLKSVEREREETARAVMKWLCQWISLIKGGLPLTPWAQASLQLYTSAVTLWVFVCVCVHAYAHMPQFEKASTFSCQGINCLSLTDGGKWRRKNRNSCIMSIGQEKRELQWVNNKSTPVWLRMRCTTLQKIIFFELFEST